MAKYKIIFYETENKEIPVEKFIDSFKEKYRTKIFWQMDLLQDLGRNLKFPYCEYYRRWYLGIKNYICR
jgi:hypothetical protein